MERRAYVLLGTVDVLGRGMNRRVGVEGDASKTGTDGRWR